ncbi:MAG: 1-acyl-sn-glycerol-3-phosphate acyltransferase [Clostridia bacterium]|jgi:1-acyl-sn-glycerol-3-phosphate acyltransferase|nr:1-acyl-sn-glycerol-3-phosphate acyltransferase [Clostridia bacterium]
MEAVMLRTIVWYTNFALSLVFKIPQGYKVERLLKAGKISEVDAYVHKTSTNWARSHVKMSGAKVKIFGEENIPADISVLFVSNHQSNFDIALFMSHIDKPKGYIAKIEMKKIPVLRTWMEYMHCVFMERGTPRKAAEAISEGIKILKRGYSMVLFPEGTRSKGDHMNEFKAGAFKLATKSGVPIVPVTIKGSYKLMEQNKSKIKPAEVEIYIHPMVPIENLTREEQVELPDVIKAIIQSKL